MTRAQAKPKYIVHKSVKCRVVTAEEMAAEYKSLYVDAKGTLRVKALKDIK